MNTKGILNFFLIVGVLTSVQGLTKEEKMQGCAQFGDVQTRSVDDLLSRHTFKGNEKVLDVGSGNGRITAAIADKLPGGSVVGVDISAGMIELAKSKYEKLFSNLRFEQKEAARLDYETKFDLITSFTVMHWVLEQKKALEGFEKMLNPGGVVWIQIPLSMPAALAQAVKSVTCRDRWKPFFTNFSPPWRFYSPSEYRDLLVDAKLKPLRLEVNTKEDQFISRDAFQCFVRQWFPYLRPLPDDLKEPFLNEIVDAYLQAQPPLDDGKVQFIVQRLDVEAGK